jgi:hypothetical protein
LNVILGSDSHEISDNPWKAKVTPAMDENLASHWAYLQKTAMDD